MLKHILLAPHWMFSSRHSSISANTGGKSGVQGLMVAAVWMREMV